MCLLGRLLPEQLVPRRGRQQHLLNHQKEGDIPDPHLIIVSVAWPYRRTWRVTCPYLCRHCAVLYYYT